jgi:hypothetical protein
VEGKGSRSEAMMNTVKITALPDGNFLIIPVPKAHLVPRFVNVGNTRTEEALKTELRGRGVGNEVIETKLAEAKANGFALVDVA